MRITYNFGIEFEPNITKTNQMKTSILILAMVGVYSLKAQNTVLAPDQNPNYMKSQEKYMAKKDELIASEGETIQQTYVAIDEFQKNKKARIARRHQRQEWRQDRRMARIQNGYYGYGYYNPYGYNNGYYNGNYGYYNGYGYKNYGYYSPGWVQPVAAVANTVMLGYLLYKIFK